MKSSCFAVAAALLSATAAAPVAARPDAAIAAPAENFAAASPSGDAAFRPHSLRLKPSDSPQRRAADVARFERMAKALPTLPLYDRVYVRLLVDETRGTLPPAGGLVAFRHTVVGTDPASPLQGSGIASYIPVLLVPVVITATDGTVYDPSVEKVPGQLNPSLTLDQVSPVFTYQPMTIGDVTYGSTQLLDAWVRAERWQYTQFLPNYHLYLSPTVGTPLRLSPTPQQMRDASGDLAPDGTTWGSKFDRALVLDQTWFDSQLKAYVRDQGVNPATIPVFVTSYDIASNDIGIGGYHFNDGTQTYIWHTYTVSKNVAAGSPVLGSVLQHELAELIDHPFPSTSSEDPGNCAKAGYEVGDPLEYQQADFALTNAAGVTYRFQDLAYAGWNEGEFPSSAQFGRYSLQNAFRFPCF